MISQNRADEKRQALGDHQWELVQAEEKQNRLLIEISQQILELTSAIHQVTVKVEKDVDAHHRGSDGGQQGSA